MKAYAKFAAACFFAALGTLAHGAANAADLVILTNQGAAPGVRELAAEFERVSGHNVTVIQPDDATLEERIGDGSADLITGNPPTIQGHVGNGVVIAETVRPFVLAGLGISVQAGAPKPDVSTVEAYVAALRAAESIGYSRGCSGQNVAAGIARLGLTEELADKTIRTEGGPVTDFLARREITFGVQQTNIMVGVPGTDYVGPVPGDPNLPCQSDVGVLTASREPEAAREMIEFMVSPEAAPILRRTHVEPYTP